MRKACLLCLLPLALGASASAAGNADDLPLLVGTVGPGFTIDLADAQGKHVDVLTEGKYQLLIHDLADVQLRAVTASGPLAAHAAARIIPPPHPCR